jgi:hypothetical protein
MDGNGRRRLPCPRSLRGNAGRDRTGAAGLARGLGAGLRASLDLLAEIAQSAPSTSSIRLLIFRPEGTGLGWAGETCLPMLEPMWGAIRVDDPGGREAARFGLATSGAVAAFDAAGRLQFLGGLNARRGRVVPSGGAEDVASVLAGREPIRRAAAVFGCAMAGATRRPDSRRAEP